MSATREGVIRAEHPLPELAAVILAGGEGRRLAPLTLDCCKPALPFAGRHRTIDFTLSNCLHSSVPRIALLAQYRADSLVPYVNQSWRARMRSAHICLGSFEPDGSSAFRGTADAVARVLARTDLLAARRILVLAGDHVYRMDYRALLRDHAARRADVTVACVEVKQAEARSFGVVGVDEDDRIIRFDEKPERPPTIPGKPGYSLASMGIYVFERDALVACLREGGLDFGRDILPNWVRRARISAHRFHDPVEPSSRYWRDVGTIDAYWQTHMELLSVNPPIDLADPRWTIEGPIVERPQFRTAAISQAETRTGTARLKSSARVRRSSIAPGVKVGEGAILDECVVLPGARIGRGVRLHRVIVGQGCEVPDDCVVGGDAHSAGERSAGGITVLSPGDLWNGQCSENLISSQRQMASALQV